MRAVDYLIQKLIDCGVTDIFGIPGGVVLDFLYAAEARKTEICPHLCYHEQGAGFAALGYAQVQGTMGVAYATRGPGFTNLITPMAEAFQESIPVLFITAHGNKTFNTALRMEDDQEMDTISIVDGITKYAARVDEIEDFALAVDNACRYALDGRMGPVFLDVYSALWNRELPEVQGSENYFRENTKEQDTQIDEIVDAINDAKRPVILVGNGVLLSKVQKHVEWFAQEYNIPILSSRGAQDLLASSKLYFGYVGSHGIRYSNFILSKADLVIALGNRMAFPLKSESFAPLFQRMKTIRVDIDDSEFLRKIPNSIAVRMDLCNFFLKMQKIELCKQDNNWIEICRKIKDVLFQCDTEFPVDLLSKIMLQVLPKATIVADVGNHEFWVSRAYEHAGIDHRILYSKSFGTLGCALPKAIGAYYKTKTPVLCIVGDQGIQLNIQELQFIASMRIPVAVLVINNYSSGMIRSREMKKFGPHFVHTTAEDGYICPNFEQIADAYGVKYARLDDKQLIDFQNIAEPILLEIEVDSAIDLGPFLPKGNQCQNMAPPLEEELMFSLDTLC